MQGLVCPECPSLTVMVSSQSGKNHFCFTRKRTYSLGPLLTSLGRGIKYWWMRMNMLGWKEPSTWLVAVSHFYKWSLVTNVHCRIFSLLVEMTSMSDVMTTGPCMGVGLCSVPTLPGISGQRKPWMLPSGHVCQWFYSFDPLFVFRRGILLSLVPCDAKASPSEVFLRSASLCNVIHAGKWVSIQGKVPTPVTGQQCCVEDQTWLCENRAAHSIGWISQESESSLTSPLLPTPTQSQHWDLNLLWLSSSLRSDN